MPITASPPPCSIQPIRMQTCDDWRRRISDPQRNAVKKVIERAADQMLRQVQSDLQGRRPDLGSGDYGVLSQVLSDFFALPQVASAVLEAAILRRPFDRERMQTHFRTVRGLERLQGIPFDLDGCLPGFIKRLGDEMQQAAQEMGSPLHNFWSVRVAADTQAAAGQTLSGVQDIRRLLLEALAQAQPNFLWVAVPPQTHRPAPRPRRSSRRPRRPPRRRPQPCPLHRRPARRGQDGAGRQRAVGRVGPEPRRGDGAEPVGGGAGRRADRRAGYAPAGGARRRRRLRRCWRRAGW